MVGPDCFKECRIGIFSEIPLVQAELDADSSFRKITFVSESNINPSLNRYLQI